MSKGKTFKFFGSEFKVATGFGSGKTITDATNADPCVLTITTHGLTGHGVLQVAGVGGMTELNGELWVFEVVTADTLRLLNCDALNFGTYTSGGTAQVATFSAHCEETSYAYDSGSTPVSEDEMVCGVTISVGAPRLGSLSLGFKAAPNTVQTALEASQKAASQIAFRVAPAGMEQVRYDIGVVTQTTETGASGATWDGTASVSLTQQRVKVAA